MASYHQTTNTKYHDSPPLTYVGGKWKLAEWIISYFPAHQTYVEPYCGGASVFFRKRPSKIEVLNDLDQRLINFYEVVREKPDELLEAISLTPYAEAEYWKVFVQAVDPVEDARRYYMGLWQSYGNTLLYRSGWSRQSSHNRGLTVTESWQRRDGLMLAIERLANVQINCAPATEVIERYDSPDTLFYVDPPYVYHARNSPRKRYFHEMTDTNHRELAEMLNQVQGKVLLSGYHSALYDELYKDWRLFEKDAQTNGHTTNTEVLWLNGNAEYLPMLAMIEEAKKDV